MAYTTIDDPSAYFHVRLYTGTGSSNSVTNNANAGDFKPDWIWIKNRTDDAGHPVFDSSRGVNKNLTVNVTDAEATVTTQVTAFGSNGFTVGSNNGANGSSDNLVAWQWKANGGTTTDGSSSDSVSTSNYQANTTAGFSIVTYTGNATAGATVAHGLGAVPKWIIVKDRDAAKNWVNYHQSIGNDRSITLNTTDAQTASTDHWHNTTPTSSVFYLGNYSHVNANSDKYVAYCFAEIQGYSKFGSYTGNGSTNGPFVYTGFKPAWVMVKKSGSGTAAHWRISDSTRSTFNPADHQLSPSDNGAEFNENDMDLLSNGFKIRQSSVYPNESAVQFIYMAFAESPFVSSKGVPTTAR
jgi:hypothetical protein